ncbi:MAG: hypothetical protein JJ911_19165 [Rhizobiaceae bacterium]|nr:hypothetical protein [Rhizobiaceae bacterium]
MAHPKAKPETAARLEALTSYVQSLASDGARDVPMTLGTILEQRIDRVRVFEQGRHSKKMVRDVMLAKGAHSGAKMRRVVKGRKLDPQLVQMFQEIEDPEIAVDFTMDMDSGAISLAVETEPVLEGQDLSKLISDGSDDAFPVFEDTPSDETYWSADEAARHFGVAKSTITRRIKSGDLIGFRLFKNELYIPKEQVIGQTLVTGIGDVLAMFDGDHRETWRFLSTALFYGDPHPRPIDRLRAASSQAQRTACLEELRAAKAGFDFGDHV